MEKREREERERVEREGGRAREREGVKKCENGYEKCGKAVLL